MIRREYLTNCDRHSITIYTDNYHVYKTIKAYAESVCEKEDAPARCEEVIKGGDSE